MTGAPWARADGALTIDLDLPPLSPLVVEIGTPGSRGQAST